MYASSRYHVYSIEGTIAYDNLGKTALAELENHIKNDFRNMSGVTIEYYDTIEGLNKAVEDWRDRGKNIYGDIGNIFN